MAKKLSHVEIATALNAFIDTTVKHFDSYAYAAGALQGQLAYALSQLPAHQQQATLQVLAELKAKYEQKVA